MSKLARLFSVLFFFGQFGPSLAQDRQEPEAMKFYRATFFVSGELMRASMVCGGDWKRSARISLDLIANSEMKAISNGFPKLTHQWLNDGAANFNNGVMTSGLALACAEMERTRAEAENLLARRR